MGFRRRVRTSRRDRGAALALVFVLLAHVALAPPASALERAAGSKVECACPDDGLDAMPRDDAPVPGAPLDGDACEQCECCAGPAGAAWITADSPRILLGCQVYSVVDGIAPAAVDPPRIPKPPERPSR